MHVEALFLGTVLNLPHYACYRMIPEKQRSGIKEIVATPPNLVLGWRLSAPSSTTLCPQHKNVMSTAHSRKQAKTVLKEAAANPDEGVGVLRREDVSTASSIIVAGQQAAISSDSRTQRILGQSASLAVSVSIRISSSCMPTESTEALPSRTCLHFTIW